MTASPSWLFRAELPLPEGCEPLILAPCAMELGAARLAAAAEVVGEGAARAIAARLGAYALDDDLARESALAGLELGEGGEVPSLSPARWAVAARAESWSSLRARLAAEGGRIAGLRLAKDHRDAFLRFLARNRVGAGERDGERIVALARHFFFAELLEIVLRHDPLRGPGRTGFP